VFQLFRTLVLLVLLLPIGVAEAGELVVIANPSVDTDLLTAKQIAAIYLLRVTLWADGTQIIPVNREAASDLRAQFTTAILDQDNAGLAAYWNEMHFQGKLPPLVQESEAAMLAFVQKVPGAIGYISAATPAVDVKVLAHVP
jgi:ABC-type phosphate transport system substrate-binding protein